ncbi:MAG TPA: NYN domain-containing protein [Myxococcales bacterium]|nr:NYN domain-containing protein [Myxococcales bacterium]
MSTSTERRIALFIDFENLVTNTGISPSSFDLRPSLDLLLERGKVIFRRAYCDWSRFREAKAGLHEHGVELIDVPPTTRSGKNGADMRLVIDALELNYARQHIDTFAIASGDSDFVPLANKLRENDKRVLGLAVKEATSPFFVRACDEFLYLPVERGGKRAPERPSRAGAGHRGGRSAAKADGGREERTSKIPALAREVLAGLLARATGPINPSLIKETMVRREPDFDESDHGFSTFSKLLEAMEREGLLKRQRLGGRQWYVVPPDVEVSEPAGAAAPEEPEHEEEEIPDPRDA